ncbi:hypothetical protein WJX82_001346 [Trebouxia sp. C0006]
MGKLSWHVERPPPFAFVTPDQQIKPFGRSLGPKHAHLHPSNLRVDDIPGSRPTQHCFTTPPRLTNPLEPHYPLPHHNHPQPAAPVLKFIKDPLDNSDIPGAQASPRIRTQQYKQNFRLDCSDVDGAAPGWQPDWKRAAKARHASLRPATAPTHRHTERAVRPSNYVSDIERASPWHPSNADAHESKVHAADVAASSHAAAQQLLQQKVESAGPRAVATLWNQFRQLDREASGKLTTSEWMPSKDDTTIHAAGPKGPFVRPWTAGQAATVPTQAKQIAELDAAAICADAAGPQKTFFDDTRPYCRPVQAAASLDVSHRDSPTVRRQKGSLLEDMMTLKRL